MGSKTQTVQAPYQSTSTATYGFQSLPGTDGAQAVQDFKNSPTEIDPSVAQRSALREQELSNTWNNDFTSGLPQHLRMALQGKQKRELNSQSDYERQNAQYAQNQQELAKRGTLLPQMVQTGGTSQGYNTQVIQKPSIWGQILGAGAQVGSSLGSAAIMKSDERLKDIEGEVDAPTAEAKINALKPIGYQFKQGTGMEGQRHEGLGAGATESVIPEAVSTDPQSGVKMINLEPVVANLIKTVQELSKKVDGLSTGEATEPEEVTSKLPFNRPMGGMR